MGDLEQSVWSSLSGAHYVVRSMLEAELESVGVPLPAFSALAEVASAESPLRVVDLADKIDLSPSRTSRLVRELELSRYVERTSGVEDGRTTFVAITEAGAEALKKGATALDSALRTALDHKLAKERLERLADDLDKLRRAGR